MEAATEEQINMARGKRSKRQRPSFPFANSNSTSANCGSIPTSFEEEADMASCLILLAQGASASAAKDSQIMGGKAAGGFECKTCNGSFPSFQALGGHRASHKKNKIDEKNKADYATTSSGGCHGTEIEELEEARVNLNHHHHQSHEAHNHHSLADLPIFPVHHNTHKPSGSSKLGITKVHECSICGSEFMSGQALGGHMRRHRPPVTMATGAVAATGDGELKHAMTLDLNLPPVPEDDRLDSKFHEFASREQRNLIFSSPAPLVDCHY